MRPRRITYLRSKKSSVPSVPNGFLFWSFRSMQVYVIRCPYPAHAMKFSFRNFDVPLAMRLLSLDVAGVVSLLRDIHHSGFSRDARDVIASWYRSGFPAS